MNHEIRIPIKQPGFHGKYPRVFFVAQVLNHIFSGTNLGVVIRGYSPSKESNELSGGY